MLFAFYDKDKNGLIESSEFLKVVSAVYDYKGLNKKEYSPQKCMNDLFLKIEFKLLSNNKIGVEFCSKSNFSNSVIIILFNFEITQ